MQENSGIYEITKMINDEDIIKNDLKEAFELVSDLFRKKYFNKLETEIKVQTLRAKENPVKEVQLLNTMKLFIDDSKHEEIDNLISVMTTMNAFSSIRKDIATSSKATPQTYSSSKSFNTSSVHEQNISDIDASVKSDGVYDVDESCLVGTAPNIQNIFFMMMLSNAFKI